jgi:flagellar secretion chaperone FliS
MTAETDAAAESLRRYLANQVNTSTPAQRLLMLFDQLRRDLYAAELGFGAGDFKEISDNLVHAQEILIALRDPLDLATELGRSLSGVYGFCIDRLVLANLKKDITLLPVVQGIVDRLAEANRTAAANLAGRLEPARAS